MREISINLLTLSCLFVFQGARGPNGSVGEKVKRKKRKVFNPSFPFSGFTVIGLWGREKHLRGTAGEDRTAGAGGE